MATVPFVGSPGDRASTARMTWVSSGRGTAGFRGRARFVRMRRCLIALLVALATPCAASADPLGHGLMQLQRDVANDCRFAGACSDAIAAYERSDTHRTLAFQYELGSGLPLRDAPWVGTHNSFNSATEMGPTLSDSDPNQQLSLIDQLRLDVRSLELDVHWFLNRPVVCHAEGDFTGCSIEQTLDVELAKIDGWLARHPDQVVLLYLEDHLGAQDGHDAGARMIEDTIGPRVYRPSGGCQQLPLDLTREAVRAAGKQVIIVGGCGTGAAYQGLAFSWDEHVETRPIAFQGPPGCGPDFPRAVWDATLVRYYEDSTFLTDGASYVGQSTRDDGLTPATTTALVRCGADLLGFDQLLPDDGRLDAAAWSWAPGEPRAGGGRRCIVQRPSDARWELRRCSKKLGEAQGLPRTGYENWRLHEAAGGRPVLLRDLRRSRRARR
jgi:hypothetical protein